MYDQVFRFFISKSNTSFMLRRAHIFLIVKSETLSPFLRERVFYTSALDFLRDHGR